MSNPVASTRICASDDLDCFEIDKPSKLIMTGNSSATILYEGETIGTLSASNRIFETCLTGQYCIKWANAKCANASIYVCECDGCEDLHMTVIDNGDGTVTGVNVDNTIVTWDKTNPVVDPDTDISDFKNVLINSSLTKLVITEDGVDHEVYIEGSDGLTFSGLGTDSTPMKIQIDVCAAMGPIPSNPIQLCF